MDTYSPYICIANGFWLKNDNERKFCKNVNTSCVDCRSQNNGLPYETQIGRMGRPSMMRFEFTPLSNDQWENTCDS